MGIGASTFQLVGAPHATANSARSFVLPCRETTPEQLTAGPDEGDQSRESPDTRSTFQPENSNANHPHVTLILFRHRCALWIALSFPERQWS